MLSLSHNFNERCYIDAAKKTFNAADDKQFCEKIDIRFSYGKVSAEEYRNHYDPSFWPLRKVSWIVTVPFRLLAAIAALTNSLVDLARRDSSSAKINSYSAARLCEYAAGDLICIFNDCVGQQWTTDAYAHIKFYFLAKQQPLELRQKAFNEWFKHPLEVMHNQLKAANDSLPPWVTMLAKMK